MGHRRAVYDKTSPPPSGRTDAGPRAASSRPPMDLSRPTCGQPARSACSLGLSDTPRATDDLDPPWLSKRRWACDQIDLAKERSKPRVGGVAELETNRDTKNGEATRSGSHVSPTVLETCVCAKGSNAPKRLMHRGSLVHASPSHVTKQVMSPPILCCRRIGGTRLSPPQQNVR